jgi:hypothetical protein
VEELIYSHLLSLAHKGLQQCIRYVSASAILGLISPYCIINSIKAGLCSLLSIRKAHPQVYAVAIKGCSWSDCWTESSIVSRLRQRGSDRLSTAPQTSRVESDGVVCIADKGSTLSPPSQPLTRRADGDGGEEWSLRGPVARGISPFARWIESSPPVLRFTCTLQYRPRADGSAHSSDQEGPRPSVGRYV